MISPSLRRGALPLAASVLLIAASVLPLLAQDGASKARVDEVLKKMRGGRGLGRVAISPDGSMLVYVHQGKSGNEIALAPIATPEHATRVTAAKKDDASHHSPAAFFTAARMRR